MGHRALVAYERPDGRYDRGYAQWGATDLSLRHRITAETPFAGGGRNGRANGTDERDERWRPTIDPTPQATALTFEDAVRFDYRAIEAFFVVSLSWDVTAFLPLWFGTTIDAKSDAGALVEVHGEADMRDARRWFRATRAVVRDMVGGDVLDADDAIDYLDSRVTEWAGDRREVVFTR